MMQITEEDVIVAYRKLKKYVYYDKTNLHLRVRLAQFECSQEMQQSFSKIVDLLNNPNSHSESVFHEWCENITFQLVPKGVDVIRGNCSDGDKTFLSNVSTADNYKIKSVNYFFDGPVELHLISVLWVMYIGKGLDKELGGEVDGCYGARLHYQVFNENDASASLFKRYQNQYSRWRDNGLKDAKRLLVDEKKSVYILGLDLQKYFYHVNLDFGVNPYIATTS